MRIEQRPVAGLELHVRIVAASHADVHAGVRTLQRVRRLARMFQRFPRHLEQQPLLRIHALRFASCDTEKCRIKLTDVAQESTAPRCDRAGMIGIGMIERIHIPSIGRHITGGVDAIAQQTPETCGVIRLARHATSKSDDGDRFTRRGFHRFQARARLLQRDERALEWR